MRPRNPDGPDSAEASNEVTPAPQADTIRRNTAFALAAQMAGAVFTAALTVFLVRALGPYEYGLLALAMGIGGVLLIPSDLGISQSTARFVAERRQDTPTVAAMLSVGIGLKAAVAVTVSVALAAAAGPISAAYGAPGLEWPVRAIALALIGHSFLTFFAAAFTALGRVALYLRVVLTESALEVGTGVALVLLGAGATGALLGRATGYLVATGLGLFLLARHVGAAAIRPRRGPAREHTRRLLGYAGSLLIIDGAFTLFSKIDVLLIGAILTVRDVGLFEAPARLVSFLGYAGQALSKGVAPGLARGRTGTPNIAAFQRAIRLLILVQAFLTVPIVVWAGPITELILGPGYGASAEVLRLLAPFVFLSGISPLLALGLNYHGEARRRIPIAVGAVLINLAIDLTLLPRIGIAAGAIATDVAYIFYTLSHLWICHRVVGVRLRPLAASLLRSALAGAVMAALLVAFGTSDLSILDLLGGGLIAAVGYGAVLLVTGEVEPSELRALLRSVDRRDST